MYIHMYKKIHIIYIGSDSLSEREGANFANEGITFTYRLIKMAMSNESIVAHLQRGFLFYQQ